MASNANNQYGTQLFIDQIHGNISASSPEVKQVDFFAEHADERKAAQLVEHDDLSNLNIYGNNSSSKTLNNKEGPNVNVTAEPSKESYKGVLNNRKTNSNKKGVSKANVFLSFAICRNACLA